MHALNNIQIVAHRLTRDNSGKFATQYLHVIAYIAIAAALGTFLLGDNAAAYLSEFRRVIFGTTYG